MATTRTAMVEAIESIARMRRLITIGSSSIIRNNLCGGKMHMKESQDAFYADSVMEKTPMQEIWQVKTQVS